MDFQVHVASEWMKNLIQKSGLDLKREPLVIPLPSRFDITERLDHRKIFREKFRLSNDELVIGFRDTNQWQKNIKGIEDLLIDLPQENIVIVSVDQKDNLYQFKEKYRVIELGSLDLDIDLKCFYSGIDIFLNLSTDEAYGMMAAESTSLGTPVMAFKNTATFETLKKYGGFPIGDIKEGVNIIRNLMEEPTKIQKTLCTQD
jgi:glycosyltransferase involved in cell wall biosynthesis